MRSEEEITRVMKLVEQMKGSNDFLKTMACIDKALEILSKLKNWLGDEGVRFTSHSTLVARQREQRGEARRAEMNG